MTMDESNVVCSDLRERSPLCRQVRLVTGPSLLHRNWPRGFAQRQGRDHGGQAATPTITTSTTPPMIRKIIAPACRQVLQYVEIHRATIARSSLQHSEPGKEPFMPTIREILA